MDNRYYARVKYIGPHVDRDILKRFLRDNFDNYNINDFLHGIPRSFISANTRDRFCELFQNFDIKIETTDDKFLINNKGLPTDWGNIDVIYTRPFYPKEELYKIPDNILNKKLQDDLNIEALHSKELEAKIVSIENNNEALIKGSKCYQGVLMELKIIKAKLEESRLTNSQLITKLVSLQNQKKE